MMNRSAAVIYIFGLFASNFALTFIKYLGTSNIMEVDQVIFFRAIFALLITTPFSVKSVLKFRTQNKYTILSLIALGLLATADSYLWNIGVQQVPINNAMILLFVSPVITATLSALMLKEKIDKNLKMSLLINSLAIFFIYRFSVGGLNAGYALIMLDFFVYSFAAMLIKKLSNYSAAFLLFVRLAIMLPISFFVTKELPSIDSDIIPSLLLLTACYIIERYCITKAYQLASVSSVQPLRYFGLIFSAFFSYIILHETLDLWQIIGVSVILITNFFFTKHNFASNNSPKHN